MCTFPPKVELVLSARGCSNSAGNQMGHQTLSAQFRPLLKSPASQSLAVEDVNRSEVACWRLVAPIDASSAAASPSRPPRRSYSEEDGPDCGWWACACPASKSCVQTGRLRRERGLREDSSHAVTEIKRCFAVAACSPHRCSPRIGVYR